MVRPAVLLALAVFLPLTLVYALVFRRRMNENGRTENRLFVAQNKTLYETLRGYSDIEINNAERYVSDRFRDGLRNLTDCRRRAMLVRTAAGRMAEFSLILGVVVMIIIGLASGTEMSALTVSLGVFAVAAYKIVPSVNRIVNSWVEYKRNAFAAEKIAETFADAPQIRFDAVPAGRLPFEREIKVDDVTFRYEPEGKAVLDRFSLTIRKGEKIGIRGYSGAGKTTLFNILCGFFRPESGEVRIDGTPLSPANTRQWQDNLAYVSQDVFIPDMTLAENIAFGKRSDEIDAERLQRAIRAASLTELVASLPQGTDTVTGEAGCRLSGGQRQRVGIAQALLGDPEILVLDEPTAGLDPEERIRFRGIISDLSQQKLVLLSTHIVSDLEAVANEIILLRKGVVLEMQKPASLLDRLNGQVWLVTVPAADEAALTKQYTCSNVMHTDGKSVIRLLSESAPRPDAVPTAPNMEDLYLYYFGR